MKKCPKCGEEKPFTEFHRNKRKKDGYQCWCKDCEKAYRVENQNQICKQKKAYHMLNRDRILKRMKTHYAEHREEKQKYRAEHREEKRRYDVKYRDKRPEYLKWRNMINRCTRPNSKDYRRYGGRGIVVCERWREEDGFKHFLEDMGLRPGRGYHIHRIDNRQGYYRENCVWLPHELHMRIHNLKGTQTRIEDLIDQGQDPFTAFCAAVFGREQAA